MAVERERQAWHEWILREVREVGPRSSTLGRLRRQSPVPARYPTGPTRTGPARAPTGARPQRPTLGPASGSRGRPAGDGRDDLPPVDLEHGLLVAVHQVDVELVDADLGQPMEL